MATPGPTWPNVTPLGAPLRPPPCLISFFTSNRYLCFGFYHSMQRKIEFTPTFKRGHNDGFCPFGAIFFSVFVRFEGAMRSYCAAGRPPDIKLRSSLCYTCFYSAESPIGRSSAWQKWDFAIIWSFFVLWRHIPNPEATSGPSDTLNLTPTLPVNNSRKILTT